MTIKKFLFKCNANAISGFGHFSRSLNLARHLLIYDSTIQITFIGNYNDFALNLIKYYKLQKIRLPNEIPNNELVKLAKGYDYLVIDDYAINQSLVDATSNKIFKNIFLDDQAILDYSNAYLVINFRMEGHGLVYNDRTNVLLGIDYLIAKPEFIAIRSQKLRHFKKSIDTVTIFYSGILQDQTLPKLMIATVMETLKNTKINYITKKTEGLEDIKNKNNNQLKLIQPTFNIEKYYADSDIIISGGGLTKYESAFCLIPNAATSATELQYEDSLILHKEGLTYDLGFKSESSNEQIKQKLIEFVTNQQIRANMYEAAKSKFKLNPTQHLVKNIFQ